MRLSLAIHPIHDLQLGERTVLEGTTLVCDPRALVEYLREDDRLEDARVEVVRPGERCRFATVFDIVEPRAKEPGEGSDFPGILGPFLLAGRGTTHVLRGAAVSLLEEGSSGRLVEMSGTPAEHSPYAGLHHLVVIPRIRPGLERHRQRNALRHASLRAAVFLARAAIGRQPALVEELETAGPLEPCDGRPRLAYIGQIHSRQMVAEVDEQIFYGSNTTGMVPVVLHPNEWLDGAIVTANFSNAVETYFYQNHPVIGELYRRHMAGEISFVGTVATMAGSDNIDRERNAMIAAHLAKWNLGADGAVLTKYGGGAPHADMALTARICEELGIRTAVQVGPPDLSNDRSAESGLLFNYPEVDAIVYSSGGSFVHWVAPEVERVLAASDEAAAALAALPQLTAARVCGVTSQQGASRLRSFVY